MKIGDIGSWTDPRDGQVYPTRVMEDGVTWMTKNYNFKTPNSIYYDNNSDNAEYGRYYYWKEATNNLPDGWHIPNTDEWDNLSRHFDFDKFEGLFKGEEDRRGRNWGFNAMKGGLWKKDSGFVGKGEDASYLTSVLGMTYTKGDKKCHYICGMTNMMSHSTGTPDDEYRATCRLIISGY